MRIDILTILPGLFQGAFEGGMIRKARDQGCVEIHVVNIRDFAEGPHKVTDDYAFGGGPGMILKPEPIAKALESLPQPMHVILLSPQGATLTQSKAWQLARLDHLVLICGRYEGVDQRVCDLYVDDEISIGDYVLTGGEFPAMVLTDVVIRLLPGVLNKQEAAHQDSFADGLLEGPHYTRPRVFHGLEVPEVLLSGHHERIERWRRKESLRKTLRCRPDLLEGYQLDPLDMKLLTEIKLETEEGRLDEPD